MYIDATNLSLVMALSGWAVLLLCLILILIGRPWRSFDDTQILRIVPAFTVGMLMIWQLKAGVHHGLEIHLLGLTAITLMFGRSLAVLASCSVYVILALSGKIGWMSLGWNGVLVGILPIFLSAEIHHRVQQKLPKNFFVFVFISSFLNAAMVMIFTMLLLSGFMWLSGTHTAGLIQHEFMMLIPLLIFPEAFLNGSLMAVLVIYRPHWVFGFDEEVYMRS